MSNHPVQLAKPGVQGGQQEQQGQDGRANEAAEVRRGLPAYCSTLSNAPRMLYNLWTEFEFGLGGRKAACDFTPQERRAVKYKYHRRKVVWDTVASLICSGYTADTACNHIYEVYGNNKTITQIINLMCTDQHFMGGHPMLRV